MRQIIVFCLGVISLTASLCYESPVLAITCFGTYSLLVIFLYGSKGLLDPRVLLFGFFCVYSCWYPLQVLLTGESMLDVDLTVLRESIIYQHFAAIVLVSVVGVLIGNKKFTVNNIHFGQYKENRQYILSESLLMIICIFISSILLFTIFNSGANSKRQVVDQFGGISSIASFAMIAITIYLALKVVKRQRTFFTDPVLIIFSLYALVFMLITGERDVFFRLVLVVMLIVFDRRNKSGFVLAILLLAAAALAAPLSQAFKAVLLTGNVSFNKHGLALLFSNEFISASRNLYALVLYGVDHSYGFVLSDLQRAFTPSIFLDNNEITSTTNWYNNEFRRLHGYSGSSGWGFGLVAQGYLVGGVIGVACIMSFFAAIASILYRNCERSIYFYVFYILSLIVMIYVIRADVANLMSQVFKVCGLGVLVFYLSHKSLKKHSPY